MVEALELNLAVWNKGSCRLRHFSLIFDIESHTKCHIPVTIEYLSSNFENFERFNF